MQTEATVYVELYRDVDGTLRLTRDDTRFPVQDVPVDDMDTVKIDVYVTYLDPPPYVREVEPQRAELENSGEVLSTEMMDRIWGEFKEQWEEYVADEVGGTF